VLPIVAGLLLVFGAGLLVAGVHVLAGTGWALVTAAQLSMVAGGILVRGLLNAS